MQRLVLIDGSGYFYRAFWAVRELATSAGMPTNAIFGFVNMLIRLMKEYPGDRIVMVFDAPGPTFRHEEYGEYKATRDSMPEELARQIPHIKAFPPAFGIPTVEVAGVEADDVLGTLAREGVKRKWDVLVATGDKDLMQLVTKEVGDPGPGILLFDEGKGRKIGREEVRKKFGVDPEKVVDVQALLGDASDNIPGVRGIGAKTAPVLIEEYGGLDALLENVAKVKRKAVRENLEKYREDAILSRRLATILTDVELPVPMEELERKEPDRETLGKMFAELEFSRLQKEWSAEGETRTRAIPFDRYRLVRIAADLTEVASGLSGEELLSVDLETDSKDPMCARLVGISLCAREGEAFYVPVGHEGEDVGEQLSPGAALEILKPVLESPSVKKVGQNVKYDALVLRRYGVRLAPIAFDTMVGAYLADPDGGPFNLQTLARRWLGHDMILFSDVVGKASGRATFADVPLEEARNYACEDADVTLRLVPLLEEQVRERGMEGILEMEMPLIEVLLRMEMNGIRVDTGFLRELSKTMSEKLERLLGEIHGDAGEEFNVDSPKQLQKILFEKLGLKPGRKTKTGYSTDMAVLKQLSRAHPLPARILEYRTIAKLRNTYVETLPGLIHPETGRIHTSYNQAVAATGRLSSSDPNLQNIPIRTPEGREIRRAFVPEEGRILLAADYSQIELRVMAHLSEDPDWLEAFRNGEDIHARTASEVFGEKKVTDDLRRRAKEINFGILYGMSAFGLAQRLGIHPGVAGEYIDLYFSRYARVREYIDRSLETARSEGYVRTLFGRRRYVPNLGSKNRMMRMAAERIAINAPIQGTAADLMKLAMIRVQERMDREEREAILLLQVHDEIVIEVPEPETEAIAFLVREEMEKVHPLRVPLRVEVGTGRNWAELK